MDSERNADPSILGSESECDRDLRDVLRHLVVVEGDRGKASLSAVAEAAGRNDRLVPELLAALEDDATAVRVGAAWTLCALADDQPAAVEYLATRLTDRVDDGPFEVGQVFSYLRGRYPGRVADAVDVAVEEPARERVCGQWGEPTVRPGAWLRETEDRPEFGLDLLDVAVEQRLDALVVCDDA
jgi:hypothetical protein